MKKDFIWNSNSGSSKTKENKDNVSNMMLGKYWSSEIFCENGVLKNFPKFTGKRLCWSLFLIKLQA